MANVCPNCGKELPEGVGSCPNCGQSAAGRDAALFTQMTAETEEWQRREKRQRRELSQREKRMAAMVAAAVGVIAVGVFLLLFLQPSARVIRAIHAGQYERAAAIYWSDSGLAERGNARVDRAVLTAAQKITEAFANHEMDADTAAGEIGALSTIGSGGENGLLEEVIAEFRTLSESRSRMTIARQYELSGEYLAARETYLLVGEDDPDYEEAQRAAKECLSGYAESVQRQADLSIQTGDYAEALRMLRDGEAVLLTYDFYDEKLDYKLKATVQLYVEDLLTQAAALAGAKDYDGAAELLRAGAEAFALTEESLEQKREEYFTLARGQELDQAAARAAEEFEAGRYAEGFALLDALRENPEIDAEALELSIKRLEARYAERIIARADETFGRSREKLPEALEQLREALRLRELPAIQAHLEELSLYLPYSLADEDYIEKVGVIFRSGSSFEALDGTEYTEGWIWGDNESELSFRLGGAYDLLEAVFTVRRDDDVKAAASFEVWCDGEQIYASEKLKHTETEPIPISLSVKGCEKLTIRFLNDYAVSTAEDGFCYHGLCSPVVTKTIP